MTIPVKVTFRNFDHSDAVEARIVEHAEKLGQFSSDIVWCNVTVEAIDKHKNKGRLYQAAINIGLPGKTIQVTRTGRKNAAHSDIYVAIRDSFNAAARQIEDHARVRRNEVKTHETPDHGKVVRLFPYEGYGFVELSTGEVYFHRNAVVNDGFDKIEVGDEVRIEIAEKESEKGLQASAVIPIGKHHIVE
jgi:cold shock CspA family protein/ribosome-associated translation inhibitor RaiA